MKRSESKQKPEKCIALFNSWLHSNGWCPRNYEVGYSHGWFCYQHGSEDEKKAQRPDLTEKADNLSSDDIFFCRSANTWFLIN